MKWILVLLALLGLGLCKGVFAQEYETDANTVALYHFMYGQEWTDSAVKGSTQTLYEANVTDNNHLWPVTAGAYGSGYYFDGYRASSGLVSTLRLDGAKRMSSLLGQTATSWPNGISFEMMVKPSSNYNTHGPAGSDWVVLAELSGTVTIYAYQIAGGLLPCAAMQCISEANGTYSEIWITASSGRVLALNKWGHLGWTFDQANHIAKIWVNGVVAFTLNVPGQKIRNKPLWPLNLGNRWSDDALFSGTIDEVRISNIVRNFSGKVGVSSLTGKVNLSNYAGDITVIPVTIEIGNINNPITLYLDEDGRFTIPNILNGNYNVRIKAPIWLSKTTAVVISGNTDMGTVDLINGDIVENNEIDFSDINAARAVYGSFPEDLTWNARADLDGSGEVDFTDINIVRGNYGQIGD